MKRADRRGDVERLNTEILSQDAATLPPQTCIDCESEVSPSTVRCKRCTARFRKRRQRHGVDSIGEGLVRSVSDPDFFEYFARELAALNREADRSLVDVPSTSLGHDVVVAFPYAALDALLRRSSRVMSLDENAQAAVAVNRTDDAPPESTTRLVVRLLSGPRVLRRRRRRAIPRKAARDE